jgi:hypothetical protein
MRYKSCNEIRYLCSLVLQCIKCVSSNPVQRDKKNCHLKNLNQPLLGLIFFCVVWCANMLFCDVVLINCIGILQTEVEISEIIRYVQHNLTNIVVCIPMLQKQPLKNPSLQSFQQYRCSINKLHRYLISLQDLYLI